MEQRLTSTKTTDNLSGGLPTLYAGSASHGALKAVESFINAVANAFETWVQRRASKNTQATYRNHVLQFVRFLDIQWPENASELLRVSIADVERYRDYLLEIDAAPKTINGRLCAISSFYEYLREAAAEYRLPVNLPNPANSQWIARLKDDAKRETRHLSVNQARKLLSLPNGNAVFDYRDRAILSVFLYVGCRISTVCSLRVEDFFEHDDDGPCLRLHEKGRKRRVVGVHFTCAQVIKDYLEASGRASGPLFPGKSNSKSEKLGSRAMDRSTMYRLLERYLTCLPRSMQEVEEPDGTKRCRCVFHPHSLRATTATLLLDSGVPIEKVKDLLGHNHMQTTLTYDKRRKRPKQSASHAVPI